MFQQVNVQVITDHNSERMTKFASHFIQL